MSGRPAATVRAFPPSCPAITEASGLHTGYKILVTSAVAAVAVVLACGDGERRGAAMATSANATPPAPSNPRADSVFEIAGDIATDTAAEPVARWLTDANVLSLLATVNARQVEAASIELQAWQSDTVRALAAWMWREHTSMARGIDSLSRRMRMPPVAPALGSTVNQTLQPAVDSLRGLRGDSLDHAYVRQQIASHEWMANYTAQLRGVAERPEIAAFLGVTASRVGAQIARARAVGALLEAKALIDTVDSAAQSEVRVPPEGRGARRKRQSPADTVSPARRPDTTRVRPARPDSVRVPPD